MIRLSKSQVGLILLLQLIDKMININNTYIYYLLHNVKILNYDTNHYVLLGIKRVVCYLQPIFVFGIFRNFFYLIKIIAASFFLPAATVCLHISAVLPADGIESVANLPECTIFCCFHKFFEHIAVTTCDVLQAFKSLVGFFFPYLLKFTNTI